MRPAFSSTRQAAAFALLLLFLLAAPWLSAIQWLPQPKPTDSSESVKWEPFPWLQKFILDETNDIDIAFVGSSRMGYGIDTPYVQQKLDERLGRQTVVRTICWPAGGFDGLFFFAKDLLEHRRVKTLVFYDECPENPARLYQKFAPHWFRYRDTGGVLSGLPLEDQAVYYFAAVDNMPRNLLALITSNLPKNPDSSFVKNFWTTDTFPDPELSLGCIRSQLSLSPPSGGANPGLVHFAPQRGATPADVCTYTPSTTANFVFLNRPLPANQRYFARQFVLLAKNHGCKLVLLHIPVYGEKAASVITETRNWPDLLQTEVCLMGVPSARFFDGLSTTEMELLFRDINHMNENGQKYFTSLVTPALLQFYASHFAH